MRILNDIHIGALRSAGTTPFTQWQLRQHTVNSFRALLPQGQDLLLLGDLFDTANVPVYDVLATYEALCHWLTENSGCKLYNVAGNHDLSKVSTTLSSFQFLGRLLLRSFPDRYIHIEKPTMTPYGYVIPHLPNQELFDLALSNVPACEYLFLHCNYNNNFAAQSDQSLNLSKEQADAAPVTHIIIAHEHHMSRHGKVLLPGNQLATSVADWLSHVDKFYVELTKQGPVLQLCAVRAEQFIELDWKELQFTDHKFVRVAGSSEAAEQSLALTKLNKFRAASEALVVSNAIQVVGDASTAAMFSESLETVQQFSIIDALREIFTAEEMAVLEGLL